MNAFGERCVALRRQGKTLSEIMAATGRPKASVYGYIQDVPLTAARTAQIRKASGQRIRKFALARKGKSDRPFRKFIAWTPESVLLVGHLMFDGELYRGAIYNNRSASLIRRVERLMRAIYDFEPRRHQNPLTGVLRISYHNVELGLFLKKKSRELVLGIKRMPHRLKVEFLRAFFDDEGCMDFRPEEGRRRVRGYQKDVKILKLVRSLLADFDINARVVSPNEVTIIGKENLRNFEKIINFSPGVFMNGDRSNSRWKKHVEKRALLRDSIKSFKS